jgi:hypothetical protein
MTKIISVSSVNASAIAIDVFFALSLPSSSALFLLRVAAVYSNKRIITMVFGVLWLALLGVNLLGAICSGPESSCYGNHPTFIDMIHLSLVYSSTPVILNVIFNTLVFIAISIRIMSFSRIDGSLKTRAGVFFRGDGFSKLTRALLQGGQIYYLFVISFPVLGITLTFVFSSTA